MAVHLSRKVPLAELHCHLGAAVTPAIMWSIAHAQGIKLPTRDYWEFRDLITVHPRRAQELRRLPAAVPLDRAHPVQPDRRRARGLRGHRRRLPQEQRDHHRAALQPDEAEPGRRAGPGPHHRAAVRGMDRATLEYPVKPGPPVLPRPRVPVRAQRDHRGEGDRLAGPGRGGHRHRRARVGHVPRRRLPAPLPPRPPARPRDHRPHRRVRAGGGDRPGDRAAGARPDRPRRQGGLRPAHDGHDPRARHRPGDLPHLQPEHAAWSPAGTSSAGSSTSSAATACATRSAPTAPRCSRPTSATSWPPSAASASSRWRSSEQIAATSLAASFVPNVSDVPLPRRQPATREVVEREEG